ncbi:MAG: hypothetical protein ABWY71_00035 [Candidatus Saccharimonadales bacterium]
MAAQETALPPPVGAAELATMDAESQKAWALDMALRLTGDHDVENLADIAALLPGDSPVARDCYDRVAAQERSHMFRVWALRDLSLQDAPFADEAWREVFVTATTNTYLNSLGHGVHRPSALEVIIEGQTDTSRIDAYKQYAERQAPHKRLAMLTSAAKQEATFDANRAHRTRDFPGVNNWHTGQYYDATLAIAEGYAREGTTMAAFDQIDLLPPHLECWGLLKMSKHIHDEDYSRHIDEPLKANWDRYSYEQRQEILGDLCAAGKFAVARDILLAETPDPWMPARSQQLRNVMQLAEAQANTDYGAGIAILDQYQAQVTAWTNESIATGMNLPVSTSIEHSSERDDHQSLHNHLLSALNCIAMTRNALLTQRSVHAAQDHHRREAFYNDDSYQVKKEVSRMVMAEALANNGYVSKAAAEALAIGDDPLVRDGKAGAFIAIARAIHRRLGAVNTGQTAVAAMSA